MVPTRIWLAATRVSTAPSQHRLPIDRLARLHHGQAPGGRNAERVHRLADDVFPQHRPERGAAVTPAGEPRLPCPFQLNVYAIAGWRDLLAKQDRAAIAEGSEVAELVAGVRLGDGSPAFGHHIARENRGAFGTLERLRLESEHGRERPVESGQARFANRSRCRMRVEDLRQLRVGVLEVPACHVTIIAGAQISGDMGKTRSSEHVRRSTSIAPRGTSQISVSFPWLVQIVSRALDTANHAPSASTLARNRPSALSVDNRLLDSAVAAVSRARVTSDVKQCSCPETIPAGSDPSGHEAMVAPRGTT